jgi:hypothetical protein
MMQWNTLKRPSTASAASRSVISSAAPLFGLDQPRAGELGQDTRQQATRDAGLRRDPRRRHLLPGPGKVDKSPQSIPPLAAVLQLQASQAPVRKHPALSAPKISKDTPKYASASYKRSSPGLLGEARVRPWQESCYFSRTAGLYLTVHKQGNGVPSGV